MLAVAGPALIGLVSVPFRSSFGLAGGLFFMVLVVVGAAVTGGVRPAFGAVAASVLAGLFFLTPPYKDFKVNRLGDVLALIAFAVVGTVVAILVDELARLAEQQATSRRVDAALRRVATLVALGPPAGELFAAVTAEAGQLLPVDFAIMGRYEADDTIACVATWGAPVSRFPIGSRSRLQGDNLVTIVRETGRPARVDGFEHASGTVGVAGRRKRLRSTVGAPIVVEGRLWGVDDSGGSTGIKPPLPGEHRGRLAQFTELLATAVANAESRVGLARLAAEQAALRRVATLVARRDASGGGVRGRGRGGRAAARRRVRRHEPLRVRRYDHDRRHLGQKAVSPSLPVAGANASVAGTSPRSCSRPAVPHESTAMARSSGALGRAGRGYRVGSGVGTPIVVEGHLWGAISVYSTPEEALPAHIEARLAVLHGDRGDGDRERRESR